MVQSLFDRRRLVVMSLGGAGMVALGQSARADDGFWLLPHDQLLDEGALDEAPAAGPTDPSAPQIIVVSPTGSGEALRAPLNVFVRFQAAAGAAINPASFKVLARVLGGWFDVTGEIRKHAQIRADGVQASGAMLPSGNHRIRVQIADSAGRVGWSEVAFKVA